MTQPPLDHFQNLERLLALEAEAEKEQALQAMQRHTGPEAELTGATLLNLVIRDENSGLGGRVLLTLGKRNRDQTLPWNRLGVGTPVLLSEQGAGGSSAPTGAGWRGVISRQSRESIEVAFETWPEPTDDRAIFRLDLANDEIARRRQSAALDRARSAREGRTADLRDVLLGASPPRFSPLAEFEPLDPNLNPPQLEAVRFALGAADLAVIHGPPGTGKTTTVVELIRQAVRRGETVLACAPSNLAVDNIFERLLAAGENALRLGHPARVLPGLRERTLDLLVENHPDVRLAHKLAREARVLRERAGRYTRARPAPGERREMRQEASDMLAEARQIEAQVVERLLDGASVLCATTTGLDNGLLGRRKFDLCVMDEASQSTEPGAWIPILRAGRVVLAGDHCQLPPTVVSPEAARQGFNVSLLERLMTRLGPAISRQLVVQYRMHQDIMQFSSQEFYAGSLQAAPGVAGHLLSDLPGVAADPLTTAPVDFIDTAGASYDEALEPDGESRLNPQEADLVVRKVEALLQAGLPAAGIGVIAPYAAQVRLLRERLRQPDLEIGSVDGFQGREKEAIIISLVRSNRDGEIGFLADTRRTNVALTRARRKLIVIGDSATITGRGDHPAHAFYQRLVEYFETIGAYHSVWEEI